VSAFYQFGVQIQQQGVRSVDDRSENAVSPGIDPMLDPGSTQIAGIAVAVGNAAGKPSFVVRDRIMQSF
jgi:hypothetical protein